MLPQFHDMLVQISVSGLAVDSDGAIEPNANLCTISLSRTQADLLKPEDVVVFLSLAVESFNSLWRQSNSPHQDIVFYAWVDELAGQLRFGVSSALSLPFRCQIRLNNDSSVIARQLLECPFLDGISFASLESYDETTDPKPRILDVFVAHLSRCDC